MSGDAAEADFTRRNYAVRKATAVVQVMAEDADVRPTFDKQFDKTIELAEWIMNDNGDDGGDGPDDFDGDPTSPARLREMVHGS